ncbi:MAG: hypothetical protein QOC69_5929 [Mycobacterium sp.]|jgi:hypothetical protein|nr:hypothetical protein [Mycobacterium sp.]
MTAIGFVVPVLPGKEQADRDWMDEMDGPRREEYESVWKKHGVSRHACWQQVTPDGTVDVVFLEADDIPAAMEGITSSDDVFSEWFRGRVKDVHGIDLTSESPPESTQIHDHHF